ncbi:MAG: lipid-A-disaccharide synthase [Burkholderiales bacterium]|nr:lipid-A-disaccharide synthase [Burkholderiales bacterium]
MVAGETSGDLLAAPLIAALKRRLPGAAFFGIGGPKMQSEGFDSWYDMETLAVRGYAEAAKSVPRILGIRRELKRRLLREPPDLFIGVDAPDFNLGLEESLRITGIPTVHYVSPSIWAWRGERVHRIRRAADHLLALFPFEPELYEKVGLPVTYVGHPFADEVPEALDRDGIREQMRIPATAPVFALLPGSRQGELEQHAGLFVETAKLIHAQLPEARFLVPLGSRPTRMQFEDAQYRHGGMELPITVLFGHARLALIASDVALVASGTATLETALLRRSMVITYRVPKLTWRLMWPRRRLPYIGLPNVLAGRFVVPEILQDQATPENLAQALLNQLRDKVVRQRQERCFEDMYTLLRQGAAERAAEAVVPLLQRRAQPVPAFGVATEQRA